MIKITYFWLVILCLGSLQAATGYIDQLSKEELDAFKKGEFLVSTQKRKNKSWPRVKVRAFLRASPIESVAMFAAYDYQKNYIPNLVKSEIHSQKEPTNIEVHYELSMPWPLSNSHYIHGHHLKSPSKDHYQVNWYLVKSDSAENVDGFAYFEPYEGGTLMTYESEVDPKSFFAGIFRKFMIRDVKASIDAIIKTTLMAKEKKPELLKKYIQKIDAALAGKKAY